MQINIAAVTVNDIDEILGIRSEKQIKCSCCISTSSFNV